MKKCDNCDINAKCPLSYRKNIDCDDLIYMTNSEIKKAYDPSEKKKSSFQRFMEKMEFWEKFYEDLEKSETVSAEPTISTESPKIRVTIQDEIEKAKVDLGCGKGKTRVWECRTCGKDIYYDPYYRDYFHVNNNLCICDNERPVVPKNWASPVPDSERWVDV